MSSTVCAPEVSVERIATLPALARPLVGVAVAETACEARERRAYRVRMALPEGKGEHAQLAGEIDTDHDPIELPEPAATLGLTAGLGVLMLLRRFSRRG